jgi:mutual gliding-motility protein MglA
MSFIDPAAKEINLKLVYYGPGLCGKTTNLRHIYNKTNPEARGKLSSLATNTKHTLSVSFMSPSKIGGFQVRFHLYTVFGPVFHCVSRRLILKGVDGLVFVADSQAARMTANLESMDTLIHDLALEGKDPTKLPMVLQYNKRDLPTAMPLDEMRRILNIKNAMDFEAIAPEGMGVFEPLKAVTKLMLDELR